MKIFKKIFKVGLILSAVLWLASCASVPPEDVEVPKGPPPTTLLSSYDAVAACVRDNVPETGSIRVAVGDITDSTGKLAIGDGGTGAFVPATLKDPASAMLGKMGFIVVDLGNDFKGNVDWLQRYWSMQMADFDANKKPEKKYMFQVLQPQFMVRGSVGTLDSGWASKVFEATVGNIGPQNRQYRANASVDTFFVAMPSPGGQMAGAQIGQNSTMKQILADVDEFGIGTFFDDEFFHFRAGEQAREPMQYAVRSAVEHSVIGSTLDALDYLARGGAIPSERIDGIADCQTLLADADTYLQ